MAGRVSTFGLTAVCLGLFAWTGCAGGSRSAEESTQTPGADTQSAARAAAQAATEADTPSDPRPATAEERERAQQHLGPLKKGLMAALKGAMEEGGPNQAIEVCRTLAPEIAGDLSKNGVELGRTSHRLRNPDNAPRDWVAPILSEFLQDPERTEPQWVEFESGRAGYVEPIRAQGLCLTCHGTQVDSSVRDAIANHYPEDAAVGFESGDLRGLFWLEMPRQ